MNIPNHFWVFAILTITFTLCVATTSARHFNGDSSASSSSSLTVLRSEEEGVASAEASQLNSFALRSRRSRRSVGDFFGKLWTIGSLGKAQYDDTRSSLARIYDILRDQFSDTMVKKTPAVVVQSGAVGNGTSSGDGVTELPATTTTEKYRISRKELGRILNRNFRGLKRLAEIERRDAQNATKYNIQEYKVQLANSLQSFVYNLPSN